MPRLYEPFNQVMETPVRLRCVTMLLMEDTFFTMIPFGWVDSSLAVAVAMAPFDDM